MVRCKQDHIMLYKSKYSRHREGYVLLSCRDTCLQISTLPVGGCRYLVLGVELVDQILQGWAGCLCLVCLKQVLPNEHVAFKVGFEAKRHVVWIQNYCAICFVARTRHWRSPTSLGRHHVSLRVFVSDTQIQSLLFFLNFFHLDTLGTLARHFGGAKQNSRLWLKLKEVFLFCMANMFIDYNHAQTIELFWLEYLWKLWIDI